MISLPSDNYIYILFLLLVGRLAKTANDHLHGMIGLIMESVQILLNSWKTKIVADG